MSYQLVYDPLRNRPLGFTGPYPASVHDACIWKRSQVVFSHFRSLQVARRLPSWCRVLADGGYGRAARCWVPYTKAQVNASRGGDQLRRRQYNRRIQRVRWMIEAFFGRLKRYEVLRTPWRHSLKAHGDVATFLMYVTVLDIDLRPLKKPEGNLSRL